MGAVPSGAARIERGVDIMEVLHERAAGLDISKKDAKVCVRVPSKRAGSYSHTVTTYGAFTNDILRLRRDLEHAAVTVVVMEATGDYWKPFFFVLSETLNVELVNAKQAKNIPGRKTDVSDARWLTELAAHGLLRASFVPPEQTRQLRDLTRTRTNLTREQTREYARMEKNLEDSNIKLSLVASSLTTKSAHMILSAMVDGERDPHVLAGLAHVSMIEKTPALVEALTGRFTDHHAFMVKLHLDRIDEINASIERINARIDSVIEPFLPAREALAMIPGLGKTSAENILAEIGIDMNVFPSSAHLASWAGVCPGQNESAGRVKSTKTRPGNKYVKGYLGAAALSISRAEGTYLNVKFRRIQARAGKLKALVAIEHTLLVIIWNMLSTGEIYTDLGVDYHQTRDPEKIRDRAIRRLQSLGYDVEVTPNAAA
jgi:transposase